MKLTKNLTLKLTSIEWAYVKASAFRVQYGLTVALDAEDVMRPAMIEHDFLHHISGISPSWDGEKRIDRLLYHLIGFRYYPDVADLAEEVREEFEQINKNSEQTYPTFARLFELGIH